MTGEVLTAVDLCCGAGGWAVAARGLPIRIVAAVDWWDRACETYHLNHPGTTVIRADGRAIPLRRGGYDVILGGIPCQWLSVVRHANRRGKVQQHEIDRERALLDSIIDFVRDAKPRWWCLEDVVQIVRELLPLTPYRIINSRSFSGQRRKRAYVGSFPKPVPNGHAHLKADAYFRPGPYRVNSRNLPGRREFAMRGTWQLPDRIYPIDVDAEKFPTVITVSSRHDSKYAVRDPRLVGGCRQLEWTEAAKAQGYPDDYVFVGSGGDAAQMVANSVQIDTARAILVAMCEQAGLATGGELATAGPATRSDQP